MNVILHHIASTVNISAYSIFEDGLNLRQNIRFAGQKSNQTQSNFKIRLDILIEQKYRRKFWKIQQNEIIES